jgi:hypothetical protein
MPKSYNHYRRYRLHKPPNPSLQTPDTPVIIDPTLEISYFGDVDTRSNIITVHEGSMINILLEFKTPAVKTEKILLNFVKKFNKITLIEEVPTLPSMINHYTDFLLWDNVQHYPDAVINKDYWLGEEGINPITNDFIFNPSYVGLSRISQYSTPQPQLHRHVGIYDNNVYFPLILEIATGTIGVTISIEAMTDTVYDGDTAFTVLASVGVPPQTPVLVSDFTTFACGVIIQNIDLPPVTVPKTIAGTGRIEMWGTIYPDGSLNVWPNHATHPPGFVQWTDVFCGWLINFYTDNTWDVNSRSGGDVEMFDVPVTEAYVIEAYPGYPNGNFWRGGGE